MENDNTLNSVIGSGDGAGVPQDINRGWYLIPAEIYAERNRQGVGAFHRRAHRKLACREPWLSTRATFGYDVTNQPGYAVVADGRDQCHCLPRRRPWAKSM